MVLFGERMKNSWKFCVWRPKTQNWKISAKKKQGKNEPLIKMPPRICIINFSLWVLLLDWAASLVLSAVEICSVIAEGDWFLERKHSVKHCLSRSSGNRKVSHSGRNSLLAHILSSGNVTEIIQSILVPVLTYSHNPYLDLETVKLYSSSKRWFRRLKYS